MSEQPRILFLFSDTGGGHRSAAEAVIEALEGAYPNRFDIRLVDAFKEYAPRPLNYLPASYPFMVRSPRAWGLGYRISNGHGRARAMTGIAWPYVRAASRHLLADTKPDLVVSVHPVLVAPVIRALGHDRPPVLTVVTDLVTTHALWYHHRVDLCLVPTESARQRALAFGMRPEQVDVVGLPVSERFCQPVSDPLRLRQELGWPPDRPMVLVVGGGEGMGPLYEIARALASKGGNLGLAVVSNWACRRIARPDAAKRVAEVIAHTLSRRFPSPAPGAQSFRTPV
jgi:1,2-diacylglycerol 3-beta-galactosyltransferase